MSLSDFILFIEWIIYLFQVFRSFSIDRTRERDRDEKKKLLFVWICREKKRETIEKGSVLYFNNQTTFNGRSSKKTVHYFSRELLYFCRFGIWLFLMEKSGKTDEVHVNVHQAFSRQHVRLSAVRADGKPCTVWWPNT